MGRSDKEIIVQQQRVIDALHDATGHFSIEVGLRIDKNSGVVSFWGTAPNAYNDLMKGLIVEFAQILIPGEKRVIEENDYSNPDAPSMFPTPAPDPTGPPAPEAGSAQRAGVT